MGAMPLVPVPSPSPAVEHLFVEIANDPRTATSTTTAIVGGSAVIAAAILTHTFTRNRDQGAWVRERMFDVSKALEDSYRAIRAEVDGAPRWNQYTATPGMTPEKLLAGHDWTALNVANEDYIAALKEARLLVRSRPWEHLALDAGMRADQLLVATAYFTPDEDDRPDDLFRVFRLRNRDERTKFTVAHNAMLDRIADRYFLSFTERIRHQWDRLMNRMAVRRNRKNMQKPAQRSNTSEHSTD